MILNSEQLNNVLTETGIYDCCLLTKQFGYSMYKDEVSPLGNICCFTANVRLGSVNLSTALVFAGELPTADLYATICFQRLYLTHIGSIISSLFKLDCYVIENNLFANDRQLSTGISTTIKTSGLFHIVIPNEAAANMSGLHATAEQIKNIQLNAIQSFDFLKKSIFIEAKRDNI